MTVPRSHLAGVATAHAHLLRGLAPLAHHGERSGVRAPSRLPGWTIGHVLVHLARNADSLVHVMQAAARGDVAMQYPGGVEQRNADIATGAARTAAEIIEDLTASIERLEHTWSTLDGAAWSGAAQMVSGRAAITDLPFRRWREVLVHHVDLDIGFTAASWPDEYVRSDLRVLQMQRASRLPMGMTSLPPAAVALDDRDRLQWLLGRIEVDGLDPAGVM